MGFPTLALIMLVGLLGSATNLTRHPVVPVVVGELIVGIVFGVSGLGLLRPDDDTFSFLAHVGFALVMYAVGSRVPVERLKPSSGAWRGAARALLVGLLAVPAGLGIAAAFGNGHGLLYAVLLASSSAGLVLPALGETPLSSRTAGEFLVQLAVADAACIMALPMVLAPGEVLRTAVGTVAILGCAAACFGVLSALHRGGRRKQVHRVSRERGLAFEIRVVLTMLFVICAVATVLGVSVMLAGFALGVAVSAAGEPRRVEKQAFAITQGFFSPIFFVWIGASLNLGRLATDPSALGLGLTLGLAALAVHGAMGATGQPWTLAATTAGQLGVPIGVAAIGSTTGALTSTDSAAILLGALVTIAAVTALTPSARRVLVGRAGLEPATQGL